MKLVKISVVKVSAILTIVVSCFVLVGWLFHIPNFNSLFPGQVVMKFNAALCFLLSGIALLNLTDKQITTAKAGVIYFCAIVITVLAGLTLSEYFFKIDLGVDRLFIANSTSKAALQRISLATATNFFMLGILLLLIRNRKFKPYLQLSLFLIMIISILVVCSYIFRIHYFSYFSNFAQMSMYSAMAFFILAIGFFYSPFLNYIKFSFERKLLIGFVLIVLVISFIFYAFDKNNKDYIDTAKWVEHTKDVLYKSEQLFSCVKDLETTARGFVISGNEEFVLHFDEASKTVFVTIQNLERLTQDNPNQQQKVAVLRTLIEKRIKVSERLIELRKSSVFNLVKAADTVEEGKLYMHEIKATIAAIQEGENELLKKRRANNQASIDNSVKIVSFFQFAIVIILVVVVIIIDNNIKARNNSELALKASNERFFRIFNLSPVAISITDTSSGQILYVNDAYIKLFKLKREHIVGKLATDINMICPKEREKVLLLIKEEKGKVYNLDLKLKDGNGELKDVICSVETLEIDHKTCFLSTMLDITERKKSEEQIMAVNKELESFSYSVSHDLRAPLRAIDGYTKILRDDYGSKLDAEGTRVMNVIINNAKKMGLLIDDLLAFSRLGKQSLIKVNVDMNVLVNAVVTDLKSLHSKNDTEIIINSPLYPVQGDSSMLKQVMINLISNALKYSRKKTNALIKINSYEENGAVIYCVKDNGAGFDMKYYDKLFGVFQRLHTTEEFEGTGVGLAIVQRIIVRHHGKVWAEGAIDEGAAFYFSLPVT